MMQGTTATALARLELAPAPSVVHDAVGAIEENLFGFLAGWGRAPRATGHRGAELSWYLTGYPFALLNGIYDARLEGAALAERVTDALEFFRAQSLPMMWWVGPSSRPLHLEGLLEDAGLVRATDDIGMARLLDRPPPEAPARSEVQVRPAQDHAELRVWVRTAAQGFGLPLPMAAALEHLITEDEPDPERRYYIGWQGQRAVGTSLLYTAGDVAGLYWVSTVPEARRRGVGTAMTLAPLADAHRDGARLAVLHATPMGVPLYRRLGFADHCRIAHYAWAGNRLSLALAKLALLVGLA